MVAELNLEQEQAKAPLEERIRELFRDLGGSMSTAQFAQECIDQGIWNDDELARFELQRAQSIVRRVLKEPDASGLCYAGPTAESSEDGSPIWSQRAFWEYADYEFNIGIAIKQRDERWGQAIKLADECRDRFGTAPDVSASEDRRS